jgi:hypothetical protein
VNLKILGHIIQTICIFNITQQDTQKKAPWWWRTYVETCRICRMLLINYQNSAFVGLLYILSSSSSKSQIFTKMYNFKTNPSSLYIFDVWYYSKATNLDTSSKLSGWVESSWRQLHHGWVVPHTYVSVKQVQHFVSWEFIIFSYLWVLIMIIFLTFISLTSQLICLVPFMK